MSFPHPMSCLEVSHLSIRREAAETDTNNIELSEQFKWFCLPSDESTAWTNWNLDRWIKDPPFVLL